MRAYKKTRLFTVPLFFALNRRAVTIDRGAAILDYLASEIWGEDKTPLGTGGGAKQRIELNQRLQ